MGTCVGVAAGGSLDVSETEDLLLWGLDFP